MEHFWPFFSPSKWICGLKGEQRQEFKIKIKTYDQKRGPVNQNCGHIQTNCTGQKSPNNGK